MIFKILHILLSISSGVFSGYADVNFTIKNQVKNVEERVYYDKIAHNYQLAERTSILLTGVSIPLSSKLDVPKTVSDVLLSVAYQGIFHNLSQNIARKKPLFWVSDYQKEHNTSSFEQFAGWEWQVGTFIIVTLINYIVYSLT